jgi:septal ring factor EnvC (AmiA/AmiB activator)
MTPDYSQRELGRMQSDIDGLKSERGEIREDFKALQADLKEIRQELSAINAFIIETKSNKKSLVLLLGLVATGGGFVNQILHWAGLLK